ncbi:MAG TPA: hypothetical protein DCG48_04425 [Rhodospirillaceae bacterium]|nr:hypothetical protein [Rhodospirillaceae bacterium]|tara:strand:+ start:14020 stop:14466 length:447 start_codon:yes stop_codon:yes gene_type:complete
MAAKKTRGPSKGNDRGRKPGQTNLRTREVIALIDKNKASPVEGLIALRKKFEAAGELAGMMECDKALLPYYAARRKAGSETTVTFKLPEIKTAEDAANAMAEVLTLTGRGEMTLEEAQAVKDLIDGYRRTLETSEVAEMFEEWKRGQE